MYCKWPDRKETKKKGDNLYIQIKTPDLINILDHITQTGTADKGSFKKKETFNP